MNVLIAVASRHGSTRKIADVIAQELRASGHMVDVRNADEATGMGTYDAAILGSAVYMGAWMPEARQFIDRNREKLAEVPVWLFSSGPLGQDNPQPQGDPAHLHELLQETHARGHQTFIGNLDKSKLGFGERVIAKAVKAPFGDYRDWDAIRGWARDVASGLASPSAAPV